MVVAGAKGLAKELLEIFSDLNALSGLYFFDNVSDDAPEKLFNQFSVLHSYDAVKAVFAELDDPAFALGLGGPLLRYRLCEEFLKIGGRLSSVISPGAKIGRFSIAIGIGSCILPGAVITSGVTIGEGCLINPNATVSHDSILGNFVEVSPGVNVTGSCKIGDFSFLGSNAVIIPKIKIGRNVIVAAGAVVTKDVPDNSMVAGVPAVLKKKLDPLNF